MINQAVIYFKVEELTNDSLGINQYPPGAHNLTVYILGIRPTIEEAEQYKAFVVKEDRLPDDLVFVLPYRAPDVPVVEPDTKVA